MMGTKKILFFSLVLLTNTAVYSQSKDRAIVEHESYTLARQINEMFASIANNKTFEFTIDKYGTVSRYSKSANETKKANLLDCKDPILAEHEDGKKISIDLGDCHAFPIFIESKGLGEKIIVKMKELKSLQ